LFIADLMDKLFVLAILVIIFGWPWLIVMSKRRSKKQERSEDGARSELLDSLARLEERIQVLERIVTDDKSDLSRQFRELAK